MAIGPPIVLAPLFLEDGDGAGSALVDDLGFDGGPFDQRLSDLYTLVAVDQPNLAEFDRPPTLPGRDSTWTNDPVSTRYCLPPVSMIAYISPCLRYRR